MSSYTVALSGSTSTLRTVLFPAISLKQNKEWEVALLDFTTYNSIPNITEDVNNKLHYFKEKDVNDQYTEGGEISLVTGSYEIDDINKVLQLALGRENFKLTANNNLLRSVVKSKYYLDFTKDHSIGNVLGFPSTTPILEKNLAHTSPEAVNIIKVNSINLTCNIVKGSYRDGTNQHVLHTFYPTVPAGFKIVEKPHNLVYLPVNTSHISDIVLDVLDQDGNIVDFRGEVISVRLHIKPIT